MREPLRSPVEIYARKWTTMFASGAGMFLYGPPGGGKSSALAAVCVAIHAQDQSVWPIFLTVEQLKREIVKPTPFEQGSAMTWPTAALAAPLLVLDGLCAGGKGFDTLEGKVSDFIIHRLDVGKPICVTVDLPVVSGLAALIKEWYGSNVLPKLDLRCARLAVPSPVWAQECAKNVRSLWNDDPKG